MPVVAGREGVVTLADANFFDGLILLADALRKVYEVPIVCFDGGLTAAQRLFARTHLPRVELRPIPETPEIALLRSRLAGDAFFDREEWLLWACPFLIAESPFSRTFWLDCDVLILRNLRELYTMLDDGPVFTPSDDKYGQTSNARRLYDLIPSTRPLGPEPLLNAGVIGIDLQRDSELLQNYQLPILRAALDPEVRNCISWHDQGALIWAVRTLGLQGRVVDARWNLPVRSLSDAEQSQLLVRYSGDATYHASICRDFPSVNILHWNGMPTKLWHVLRGPAFDS